MPIFLDNADLCEFDSVYDYEDHLNIIQRVVQIYSSDDEKSKETRMLEIFANNGYTFDLPDEGPDRVNFDMDYKSMDVRYSSGTGFLFDKRRVITTMENVKKLLDIPARLQEEYEQIDFIKDAIESDKLLCYRDYERETSQISSIKDYSFDRGWIKFELRDKFKLDDEDGKKMFSDYLPTKQWQKLQMFGHPLGSNTVYKSTGYIYNLMPKYSDAKEDTAYKYADSALSFLPGSSGSPVFNSKGVFLGICTEADGGNHFKKSSSRYGIAEIEIKQNSDPKKQPAGLLKVLFRNRLKIY